MNLLDILASVTDTSAQIPEGWGQGRATYGGLVAALMQRHLERSTLQGRSLRSASIHFIGPAAPGTAQLDSELIRSGKSSLQAQCRMRQDGKVVALLTATCGEARTSEVHVSASAAPAIALPETGQAMPDLAGLVPEFTRRFDFRWTSGNLPFTGSTSADISGWVRLRERLPADTQLTPAIIMAYIDAWPPTTLQKFTRPAPISTMTWTLDCPVMAEPIAADGWWQYEAQTLSCGDGYTVARSQLWSATGQLVASSQQHVAGFL
ncbi:MAG: thioesterase family protein [Paraperlucidibaca sp.]